MFAPGGISPRHSSFRRLCNPTEPQPPDAAQLFSGQALSADREYLRTGGGAGSTSDGTLCRCWPGARAQAGHRPS
jgi:hypothetical protein